MAQDVASLRDQVPANPREAAERAARQAWQQRAVDAEEAAIRFQSEAANATARVAALQERLDHVKDDAAKAHAHGHRVGYLEGSRRFGVFALVAGMVFTFAIGEVNARLELWRQQRAAEAAVRAANDAFGQGLAVGSVRREIEDDKGVQRRNEPRSAP